MGWSKQALSDIPENIESKEDNTVTCQSVIAASLFEKIRKSPRLSQWTWHHPKGWDTLDGINTACPFWLSSFFFCTLASLGIGNHHFCPQKPDHTYSQQEFYQVCLSLPPYVTAVVKGKRKESKPLGQAWTEPHRLKSDHWNTKCPLGEEVGRVRALPVAAGQRDAKGKRLYPD